MNFVRRTINAAEGVSAWIRFSYWFAIVPVSIFFTALKVGRSRDELLYIALIGSIFVAVEMLNTAVEKLCNIVNTKHSNEIKTIKDMCAGAVLLIFSVMVSIGVYIVFFKG